jgi:hypothetical protein
MTAPHFVHPERLHTSVPGACLLLILIESSVSAEDVVAHRIFLIAIQVPLAASARAGVVQSIKAN